jgi:drug/metabolite transporter (DMT)-like permease
MKSNTVGFLSILVYELFIGVSPYVYTTIHTFIPNEVIIAIRFGLGASTLMVWLIISGLWHTMFQKISWKQIIGIAFLGIAGSGIASLWNILSVRHIGITLSTILVNLEIPIGVALGAWIFSEHLTASFIKALGVIIIGFVLVTVKNGIQLPVGGAYLLGIAYALGAAGIWAGCTVVGKKLIKTLHPISVAWQRMFWGSATNVGISYLNGNISKDVFLHIQKSDWMSLIVLGCVTSGIGLALYYTALGKLSIAKISLLFLVSPIISVVSGIWIGEAPLLSQWIGIICIIGSIGYVFMKKELI